MTSSTEHQAAAEVAARPPSDGGGEPPAGPLTVRAVLTDVQVKQTRDGRPYAAVALDTRYALIEAIIPARLYSPELIKEGATVTATVGESRDDGRARVCSAIEPLEVYNGWIGPCARCRGLCRTYGPAGKPLCWRCRGVPSAADMDAAGVPAELPEWADEYADLTAAADALADDQAEAAEALAELDDEEYPRT